MVRRKLDPPRGVLRSGDYDKGRIRHERYHPSADLAEFVEHFWMVEWDFRGCEPFRAETLPHPSVHLTFYNDGRAEVGGPSTAKFSTLLEGQGGVFAAKFTPAGFFPFAKGPVSRLADTKVELAQIFGERADMLAKEITSEGTTEGRVALVEDFLRSVDPADDANIGLVNKMVYSIAGDREIARVEDIADRHAITIRSLQRLFAKYVGVSPKWVICRYRLHEAAERIGEGPIDYARLAAELGYSDQSHFLRDFKSIVGIPPGAYARNDSTDPTDR